MARKEIFFIGSSSSGLQSLSENDFFSIEGVFCLENRTTPEIKRLSDDLNIPFYQFKWISEFRTVINQICKDKTTFFIYQLDMLVPEDLVKKHEFFNLHRGSLKTNRGPSPDIWPILLGEKNTCMSLHQINEKIDAGLLIDEYWVEIQREDTVNSIKIKLEKGLPELVQSLVLFIKGEKKSFEITDGLYRPWITEKDFTIDIDKDDFETIARKIHSQSEYNGAVLFYNNNKYYVNAIMDVEHTHMKPTNIEIDLIKNHVKLRIKDKTLICKLNMEPKFTPPPKFPKAIRI